MMEKTPSRCFPLRGVIVLAAIAAANLVPSGAHAAEAKAARTIVARTDVAAGYEVVMGHADFAPGAVSDPHRHHGAEYGYVTEGEIELDVEGLPPLHLKKGDSFHVDEGRIHGARNTGPGPAQVVSNWIIEKGKPLAEPAK